MRCLNCSQADFEAKNTRFTPEVKGKKVEVVVLCNVCKACSTPLINTEQMNNLRRAACDKYREMHGLLTSKQIIGYRETLGMSQLAFSHYLKVGEASIKRWETYCIQDQSQNDHILMKCDRIQAELNYLLLKLRCEQADIYSGEKKFSLELFRNLLAYFLKALPECEAHLGKLLFYADFLHFKKFGKGMTGVKYVPLKQGPCPHEYVVLAGDLFSPERQFSESDSALARFDDREMGTIQEIVSLYGKQGGKHVSDLASKEKGYLETEELAFISYEHARDLLI